MPRVKVRGVLVVISVEGSLGQRLDASLSSWDRDSGSEFSHLAARAGVERDACIAAWLEQTFQVLVGGAIRLAYCGQGASDADYIVFAREVRSSFEH